MRSPDSSDERDAPAGRRPFVNGRAWLEWCLRVTAVALLAWFLWLSTGAGRQTRTEQATSESLRDSLARWSTAAAPARVHVDLAHPPPGMERDWLAALTGGGTEVQWSGPSLMPTAIAVAPRADPQGGADVHVAAPAETRVTLRDTIGVLGSGSTSGAPLRAYVPRPRGPIDAVAGPVTARAALLDSLILKRLLVVGTANWETKFAVAALEERGWAVDAHLVVSPRSDVRQGTIAVIDTARYSAVLVLDTTAARHGSRIASFVRSGGGLVLWTPAAAAPVFASLAPGGGRGALIEGDGRQPVDSAPRAGLELVPITRLSDDAVVLERRGSAVALAARRLGPGRVIQTGYTDSWRWRMAGGEEAPEQHRSWLAGLVARVAHTGRVPLAAPPTAVAPLATLIDRLGPASAPLAAQGRDPSAFIPWIFALICLALFAEWGSRRLRGVK